MQSELREICIAGEGFNYHSFNSILRRAPYRKSYILLFDQTDYYYKYIGNVPISRYFPITQLKICKVS